MTPADQIHPASLIRRMAALAYDALLLVGPLSCATLLALMLRGGRAFDAHDPWFSGYLVLVCILFFGWFWRHGGQTLGMKAWRIKLVTYDSTPPSWGQVFTRCLVGLLSFAAAGLGFFWILIDRQGRSWHDRASATLIIVQQENPRQTN